MVKNKFPSLNKTGLHPAAHVLLLSPLHQFSIPFLTSAANISFGWDVEGRLISSSSRLLLQSALISALTYVKKAFEFHDLVKNSDRFLEGLFDLLHYVL